MNILLGTTCMILMQPWMVVESPAGEQRFHAALLDAAAHFKAWGRVDDEMRWAPYLCRMPNPGQPRPSASTDGATHGQKLYSLFARKRDEYFYLIPAQDVSVGQMIVKESWVPEEITDPKKKPDKRNIDFNKIIRTPAPEVKPGKKQQEHEGDHFYPYVWKGDKVYSASKPAGLFIMMKLDPGTEGTDAGWVYGTLTADGKKVTSAGKVASCMKCHQEARHDRLFGVGGQEK
ncbi:MAG TPA: hypothetical protein PLN21_16335 [Gemmatales bacterium]|nr:hypothetical protein [Gemmatales bacterium]